jgi:predicted lactoylglutathione lyase
MYKVKARNLTKAKLDMAIEVKTEQGAALVEKLMDLECMTSASLVDHDGEVTF